MGVTASSRLAQVHPEKFRDIRPTASRSSGKQPEASATIALATHAQRKVSYRTCKNVYCLLLICVSVYNS
jgi:hypothetical protein